MGQVHELLTSRGKQGAVESGLDRGIVEAASTYLGNEEGGTGFLYSGWCQSALPHKQIPHDQRWQVNGERISLVVEPGVRLEADRSLTPVGVPYGSRARLILIYLQTQALMTGNPEVELGRSLRHWFGRMGINSGGKDIKLVKDQAERISRCRLTFHILAGKRIGLVNQSIVESAMFLPDDEGRKSGLSTETARLSDGFFRELQKHPVPIEDAALSGISNNSQAIDIYCWLAYRLHALAMPISVSWKAIKGQFGQSVADPYGFRQKFRQNLQLALAVYPAAKVEQADEGLLLHPSRPPVAPKMVSASRVNS
jgi:hypothetical protein